MKITKFACLGETVHASAFEDYPGTAALRHLMYSYLHILACCLCAKGSLGYITLFIAIPRRRKCCMLVFLRSRGFLVSEDCPWVAHPVTITKFECLFRHVLNLLW